MEYGITHLSANDLFIVTTDGIMNLHCFLEMAESLLNHPSWAPNKSVIFNHEDLDFSHVSFDDIQKIRAFHAENEDRIGGGKSAIVLKKGFLHAWNNLWSQGEKIQTANSVKIFERHEDAMNWILDG